MFVKKGLYDPIAPGCMTRGMMLIRKGQSAVAYDQMLDATHSFKASVHSEPRVS